MATSTRKPDERIRALGFTAPGTYRKFAELSAIKQGDGVPKAEDMIRLLVEGHETVARTARERLADGKRGHIGILPCDRALSLSEKDTKP